MDSASPPEVNIMSSNVVRVNGVEVTSDSSKPTVININFNQPSPPSCFQDMLHYLGKAMKSLRDGVRSSMRTNVSSSLSFFAQAKCGLQVARIVIGLASISLGILLCLVHAGRIFEKGTGFWTGFPFLLSGILSIGREKSTSRRLWLWISRLMNLSSFAVAIAGIVVIADDLKWWSWGNYDWTTDNLCEPRRGYNGYNGWYRTTPPSYDDFYRENHCKDVTGRLLSLFMGVRVLLLLVVISGLITTLCSVGCDLWVLFCTSKSGQEEEEASVDGLVEPLLPSLLPPAYEEKQNHVQTV
ncbi:transmembrane protein 176B-like isoform X2 [Ambystoma mexicanum]|uniref:transmembrane protein 176B-like isoform X2 n=1 Tax=Ambystoma mexicanum TaxID=8296 RepID=UPI0037E73563